MVVITPSLSGDEIRRLYGALRSELNNLSVQNIRNTVAAAGIDVTQIPSKSEARTGIGSRAEVMPAIDRLFGELYEDAQENALCIIAERLIEGSPDLAKDVQEIIKHGKLLEITDDLLRFISDMLGRDIYILNADEFDVRSADPEKHVYRKRFSIIIIYHPDGDNGYYNLVGLKDRRYDYIGTHFDPDHYFIQMLQERISKKLQEQIVQQPSDSDQ